MHKVDKESYVSDLLLLLFLIQAYSYSVKVVQTIEHSNHQKIKTYEYLKAEAMNKDFNRI